jgi:NOL1/NOP2/fmu family ribosome biogenesis protein
MYETRSFKKRRHRKGIRCGVSNAEDNKLQKELEIAYKKNAGRKSTKANDEIPAKWMAAPRKVGWKCETGTGLILSMEEEEEDFILFFISSYAV